MLPHDCRCTARRPAARSCSKSSASRPAAARDVSVWSFGSRLANRKTEAEFVNGDAYRNYLRVHAHDDAAFFHPLGDGWQDPDDLELAARDATSLTVRGKKIDIPTRDELHRLGIEPSEPDRLRTFEVCRYVAAMERELVLATPDERRTHVPAVSGRSSSSTTGTTRTS